MGLFNLKCTQYCEECLPKARLLWCVMVMMMLFCLLFGLVIGNLNEIQM